jgi:hypothetical protein
MYTGAPFGLRHLTTHMQRMMETILSDCLSFTLIYVDDIVIFSSSLEDHIRHVIQVLRLFTRFNLRLNLGKCHFCFSEIAALGHRLGPHGRSADPSKCLRAFEWTTPVTGQQMQAFLGFTNYLRDYILHYASLTAPLDELRHVAHFGPDNGWLPRHQAAFDAIKHALRYHPQFLQAPLPERTLHVATDASQYGVL